MHNQPHGDALLVEARRVMLEVLLPQLPKQYKYEGLMVANAMGIAAREFVQSERQEKAIEEAIGAFYHRAGFDQARGMTEETLAEDIRQRRFTSSSSELQQLLRDVTRAKLSISKPKRLKE